jgi:hypothetical protein
VAPVVLVVARYDQDATGEGTARPLQHARALVDVAGEHRHVCVEHLGLKGCAPTVTEFQMKVREKMDTHEMFS